VFEFLFGPAATALAIASLLILAANIVMIRRLDGGAPRDDAEGPGGGLISVIIPARNEATGIVECVERALAQGGVEIEVIVVDDRSEDDTLVRAASIGDDRLTVVAGTPLPDGWTGKNWACHQGVARAHGDRLCFVDADTRLEPSAIAGAAQVLQAEHAELVSCLVAADYRTTAQAVLLPMVNHAMLALFPVGAMHSPHMPRVALALGPFMLVERDAYERVGGHALRSSEVVDDVGLCRAIKTTGGRVRIANGTSVARTRWYPDTRGIWNGFSKNAFGALDSNYAVAMLTCFVLVPLLVAPFVRLPIGLTTDGVPTEVWVQVALFLLARLVSAAAGRDPMWTIPFHPVTVTFWGATLLRSTWLSNRDRSVSWRGRAVRVANR